MADSEDTLNQEPTLADVMQALGLINQRLDNFDAQFKAIDARFKAVDEQLEIIREGIAYNASRFDRMDANLYSVRSDISNLKADLRDMNEKRRIQDLALE